MILVVREQDGKNGGNGDDNDEDDEFFPVEFTYVIIGGVLGFIIPTLTVKIKCALGSFISYDKKTEIPKSIDNETK